MIHRDNKRALQAQAMTAGRSTSPDRLLYTSYKLIQAISPAELAHMDYTSNDNATNTATAEATAGT